MLITHHQKTILESFFSVLMDVHWKNHIPSTFHPRGCGDTHHTHICELAGKDHESGLLQERGHHEIEEAHWRRWVEMKSLILVSPAQCSHQPKWSISLTATVPDRHARTPIPGGKDRHVFFCLWVFAPAANYLEMLIPSPCPFGKLLFLHSVSVTLPWGFPWLPQAHSGAFRSRFPFCLVLTANTQLNKMHL